ncbi:MAG TPA: terminase small subunit [Gemmatimonadaceae bacterium]|nr:terminase small subunit [Gemmatimonadaceae bacterium]
MARPLTAKQELFCRLYVISLNGTQSAKDAGFAAKSAHVTASKLLRDHKVKARIAELQAEALASSEGQAQEAERQATVTALEDEAAAVIAELRNHAFANLFKIIEITPAGGIRCRSLDALPEDIQRQVKKVKTSTRTFGGGDVSVTEVEYEVELWDKLASLKALAQHYALLTPAGGKAKAGEGEPTNYEVTMSIPPAAPVEGAA